MKMLTCEMLELGRIFNEGIIVKFDCEEIFIDFEEFNFKQMQFGMNDSGEVYFFVYDRQFFLKDHMKTWWYAHENQEVNLDE